MSNDNLNPMAKSPMEFLIAAIEKELDGVPIVNEQLFFNIYSKHGIGSIKDIITKMFIPLGDFNTINLPTLNLLDGVKVLNSIFDNILVPAEDEPKIKAFFNEFIKLFTMASFKVLHKYVPNASKEHIQPVIDKIDDIQTEMQLMITGDDKSLPKEYTNYILNQYNKLPDSADTTKTYWFEDKSHKLEMLYQKLLQSEYIIANPNFIDSFKKFDVPKEYRTKWSRGNSELMILIYLLAEKHSMYKNTPITVLVDKLFVRKNGDEFLQGSLRSALSRIISAEKINQLPATAMKIRDLFDLI